MMRLLPRSLFGRLLLLLVSGLLVTQVLSALILLSDRGQVLYRAIGVDAAKRIAATVKLLDGMPKDERARFVAALDFPPTHVRLDVPWLDSTPSPSHDTQMLKRLLHRHLPNEWPLRVEVTDRGLWGLHPIDHAGREGRQYEGSEYVLPASQFRIQVKLQDRTVVSFWHELPDEVFGWPHRLLVILLLVLASVTLVAVLAARWLTRPLARLAGAANELGRNIDRPPLDERGPIEVRGAARAFNAMQAQLARYIKDRSRVLAAISHDLKTPITRMKLRAEMLKEPALQDKFQTDLTEMEAMLSETLEFMRGMGERESVAPTDMNALLESLQEDYAEQGGDIVIEGTASAPFDARPLALKRCLVNLFDNALRYGERATVHINDDSPNLLLTICDEGPGIPDAELEQVFEPFYRLDGSRGRDGGGTGLGLSNARNIAHAHGGDITLRNRARGGLQVQVRLPR